MTAISNASALNTAQTMYNPYFNLGQASMANDFFGSQAFGHSLYATPQNFGNLQAYPQAVTTQSVPNLDAASGSVASAILQQYCQAQNSALSPAYANPAQNAGNRMLTLQDYATATQIANMFSANAPLINPNTNFFQKDMFAQQLIQSQRQGLNFSA